MKGPVNPKGLFFFTWVKRKKKALLLPSVSTCTQTAFFSKFPLERRNRLRQQKAALASPEPVADLPSLVSFPTALVVCQLVWTCTYKCTRTAGGGCRSGCHAPAVLLIRYPKVMLKPLPSRWKSFSQVWEHEWFTQQADHDTGRSVSWSVTRRNANVWPALRTYNDLPSR